MKTKLLLVLWLFGVVIATSCKKDKSPEKKAEFTPEVLEDVSDKSTEIFADLQSFMLDALTEAFESGINITTPPSQGSVAEEFSKITQLKSVKDEFDWHGPDANGWYYRSWEYMYKYTEKIRCQDTVLTHILSIEYSGGDGSYSNVYETQYTKYTKNKKVLWKGYADWKVKTFGDNDISDIQWTFKFEDWNPKTGAGDYDWYWGASSLGGDDVPYYRFLNIRATEGIDVLHVKITWYDGNVEVGSFEYDTTWEPVEMPEMPCEHSSNLLNSL